MTRRTIPQLLRPVALTLAVASTAAACASTETSSTPVAAEPVTHSDPAPSPAEDGDSDETQPLAGDIDRIDDGAPSEDADETGAAAGDDMADGWPAADLEVGSIELAAGDDATVSVLSDGRTVVQGTVTVPTAGADVELDDADIAVGVDADGEPTISGTARVPFPTDGAFADAEITKLPVGEVGSAYGRDLAHLGAHLQDDRRYLFFSFDGGLDVSLPFAGQDGYEAIPAAISIPTGQSAALVLDPSDPYFYVGMNCPDLSKDDNDNDSGGDSDGTERNNRSDDSHDSERNDDDGDESSDAYYTIEPSNLPAGQECGIGISNLGNIPAPATAGGDGFTGHVVVDGIVPLYAGIELDGSAVVALRDPGVRTVGWGTVLATVPLIDELVDIQIPLADAAVEIQAEGARIGIAYEGAVGGSDPTYELPLIGIPITIPASGNVAWDARLGFVREGGAWRIDGDSYAEVSGEFGLGLGSFGELIGLDLDDIASQSGSFRIDATGVTATGQSSLQLHPALNSGADAEYALRIDATEWTKSRLDFSADVALAGHTIAAADVVVGAGGIAVAGEVDFGFARAAVSGAINAAGFEVAGVVGVNLSLDGLAEASRTVSGELDELIAKVRGLDDDIERARDEVRENRRNRDAKFTAAQDALQGAIDALESLDDERNEKVDRIADLRRKIADDKAWYAGLSAGQKVIKWAGHEARLIAWNLDIAQLNTRIVLIHDTLRPAAVKVLEVAQDGLDAVQRGLDALPVDTNPKVAAMLLTREGLITTLELARGTVELFEIEGSLRGEIEMRIASDGVGGSFSGELCGPNNCTPLPGGSVQLGADTEICVALPGLGEKCLKL